MKKNLHLLKVRFSDKYSFAITSKHWIQWSYFTFLLLLTLIDLLEEQNDLNEKIMAVEKDRLDSTVDLLYSKMEVAKEFLVTKQIYKDIISSDSQSLEDDDEDMEDEDAENIDNANSDADDEEKQLQKKIRKEKKKLAREEARLNQMK